MLYILSAQIVPLPEGARALVELSPVTPEEAHNKMADCGFESAVGHEGTAQALTELLGIPVPKNRLEVRLQPGDEAIQFVLRARQPEGVVLDREAVEKIGYHLTMVRRIS